MADSLHTPAPAPAATHPLQDIPLNGAAAANANANASDDVDSSQNSKPQQQQQQQQQQTKSWVRFDDESAENVESNKLPILPPPSVGVGKPHARARSPNNVRNSDVDVDVDGVSVSMASANTNAVAVAPAQRKISAPETAQPAVLSVESNYVDLNAPRRTPRQQQIQQQQQQQQQPLQQQQKQQQQQQINQKATATSAVAATNTSQSLQQHKQQLAATPAAASTSGTAGAAAISLNMPTLPAAAQPAMRTIELSTGRIREGFANGDVIVTLLPANTKWPWVTPAVFRPELVPEELMAQGLTLTVEDYVAAMETLVNDYRFTAYNVCYKRVLVCWILFAFTVLLTLLFSGLQGTALFSLGVFWLFLNATAIFICMWIKLRLSRGLEKCLARVNKQLVPHKILLILDDRGRISCHKVNLCFLYFDATQCISYLNEFLEHTEQNGGEAIKAGWEAKLDIDLNDIVIQGSRPTRLSRKTAVAQEFFLTYLQRWGKDFLRRRLDWIVQEAGVHEMPRHLQSSICPCQYEEEILRNKLKSHLKTKQCCGINCIGCWL